MSKVLVNETNLTAIANAIRGKNGLSTKYKPSEMAAAITSLTAGGGGGSLEPIVLSGDLTYFNASGRLDELLQNNPTLFSTENITKFDYGFSGSKLTRIPFAINFGGYQEANGLSYAFQNMENLEEMPEVHGEIYGSFGQTFSGTQKLKIVEFPDDLVVSSTQRYNINRMFNNSNVEEVRGKMPPIKDGITNAGVSNCSYFFGNCNYLKTIPYDFFDSVPNSTNITSASNGGYFFSGAYSLRGSAPNLKFLASGNKYMYYSAFYGCYTLDRIINLPIYSQALTTDVFTNTFLNCHRLGQLTFERNEDGTPKTANWKNQVIDLSVGVGYVDGTNSDAKGRITNYNSGITADKEVKYNSSSSTPYSLYTQLKDDPDYWTCDVGFSRYDRKSAIETINSLPDCSASGGTNTLKLNRLAGNNKGSSSDATDMSKLSDAEIAVATAKGWTVSLV